MPSFFKNVRRRQLLLNLYLFLCNLPIALAFLKIWSDKTKLSKRFDSKKYAKKVKQMCLKVAHARNFRHFEFFMVLPYCPLKTVQ